MAAATGAVLVLGSLTVLLSTAQQEGADIPYADYSFQHPYAPNGVDIPHWDFKGDTSLSDNHIRLTPDRQSRRGNLWNTNPFDPPGSSPAAPFEIEARFKVHGQGKRLFGDGFAIWYTSKILPLGGVFGSEDKFVGMGILFDTYSNLHQGHQQYVSVIIGDGKQEYDHDKDGGDAKLAGCNYKFRGKTMDARVVYDGDLLRMYLAQPDQPWEECFIVRKVHLPRGYHFGFSAATGDLADNHDIVSFKVHDPSPMSEDELMEIKQRIKKDIAEGVEQQEHHDPQYDGSSGEVGVGEEIPLWMTIAMIATVVVVAGVIFFISMRQKEQAHKHFT
eukprot:m.337146 g.337146  ORF g.337146 m.337146 type:complete len:332 (-) comp18061_c0_seq1:134-1129(-)